MKVNKDKIVLGLTGAFGSGKSTVAKMFGDLGARVVDADKLAHEALVESSPVYKEAARIFKETKVKGRGLDRKKVAAIVFRDAGRRQKLEAIVHPFVFQRMLQEIAGSAAPVTVLEIPLLFETGFDQYCHKTVVVKAEEEAANRRLAKQGFSAGEIEARRKAQMPLEEKIERADIVIDNSGTLEETRREVENCWKTIRPALKGEK